MAEYRQPCHCGKFIPLRWHHPSPGDIHISYSFLVADGSFSCIAECAVGFTLGETKEELLSVLGLQGKKGSSLEFLRRGYKVTSLVYYFNSLFYIYSNLVRRRFDLEASSAWRS
uniref:Uncharacterized protein n=1 Tax=Solanum tuberosum TaxID=4113 RepID=M1BR72_SOLTU